MAVLQFPNSPTTGNKYPQPPVAGQPVYVYDGEKWKSDSNPPNVVTVSDTPPVGAVDGTMWWESDSGLLYIMYNDGSSRQWVIAAPQPDFSTYASKAYADVSAYNNIAINGGMEVSQEYGATNSGNFGGVLRNALDGWNGQAVGSQIVQIVQAGVGPAGYTRCLQMLVTTANASPATNDGCVFNQRIEGYRVARLAWGTAQAQPITIGFWVYAVRPGNYSGSISNAANDRTYAFPFTVNTTNTWEYKTATITGCVDGVWAKDNTNGMNLYIAMMAGSSRQIAAGAWANSFAFGVTGTINGVAATSDYMLLTGVTVHAGLEGPSAARSPYLMRSYADELLICRRYYYTRAVSFSVSGIGGSNTGLWLPHPIAMRVAPTLTASNQSYANGSGLTVNAPTVEGHRFFFLVTASGGAQVDFGIAADARL